MGIVGAVVVNPTVVTLTETAETATFPEANLQVVAIVQNSEYIKIPIDSSRNAVIANFGGNTTNSSPGRVVGTFRKVNFPVTGTSLNYSIYALGTTPIAAFYYGTPLQGSKSFMAFAGVTTAATLSSGAGSGTWTFPSGNLKLTAVSAGFGLAAASTALEITWTTSSGKTMNALIPAAVLTGAPTSDDLVIMDNLPIAQTVAFTLSQGTGSDKTVSYAFYQ